MKKKIALLTCNGRPELVKNELALAKMFPPEIRADVQIWNDPNVNWEDYNCLVFRTIWDYYFHPTDFEAWLSFLEGRQIPTLNPVATVQRNQHKFYLRELETLGVKIIPTVFIPKNSALYLSEILRGKAWEKAVMKPAVSAGSFQTRLFDLSEIEDVEAEYLPILAERDLLLQPFMPEIKTLGEISMIFFNGQFSHAILKKPLPHDFRVQIQYGGQYAAYFPEKTLIETGEKIVEAFGGDLLYARVDGVLREGQFFLMELELIEPDLYFDFSPGARERFAAALSERL